MRFNLLQPYPSSEKENDAVNEKSSRHVDNEISPKLKKLFKTNSHIKSSTPVSSMNKKEQSSKSLAFSSTTVPPSRNAGTPSPSTGLTPEIRSAMNSMTPMSLHSREEFTPTGSKHQSKSKYSRRIVSSLRMNVRTFFLFRTDQTSTFDKNNEIDHHKSLSFPKKISVNQLSPQQSDKQHQIVSNSPSKSVYIFSLIILLEYY